MIISVIANLHNKETEAIAREMLSVLSAESCRIYFSEEYKSLLSDTGCFFVCEEALYKLCDIVVAIGGDGTTMKVARQAAVNGKPSLGINGGRLGFLSAIEKNELSMLRSVIAGNYTIDERIMLKAEVVENGIVTDSFHCLNDAVFSRGDFARLIDIDVASDNRELLNVRADGVIISTPTGSTAYSLAAGGPILSPDLNCFVITSICPHSLVDRSMVVNSKSALGVTIHSDVSNNAILTCDGEEPVVISNTSYVRVSISEYKARLIKIKPDNFYEIVKKKIIERRV